MISKTRYVKHPVFNIGTLFNIFLIYSFLCRFDCDFFFNTLFHHVLIYVTNFYAQFIPNNRIFNELFACDNRIKFKKKLYAINDLLMSYCELIYKTLILINCLYLRIITPNRI